MKDILKRAKAILASATATSAEEEFAYFVAKLEIEEGTYSEGLMDKAFALVGGHGDAKNAKYMELRAAQLLSDSYEYFKRIRAEWENRVHREEMLVREQEKADFDQYKRSLHSEYAVAKLSDQKASIRKILTPLQNAFENAHSLHSTWMVFNISGGLLLLVAFLLWQNELSYQFPMVVAISLIVAGVLPFWLYRRSKSKQDDNTMHQLQSELSEVESKLQQYESKLKAHPNYYES